MMLLEINIAWDGACETSCPFWQFKTDRPASDRRRTDRVIDFPQISLPITTNLCMDQMTQEHDLIYRGGNYKRRKSKEQRSSSTRSVDELGIYKRFIKRLKHTPSTKKKSNKDLYHAIDPKKGKVKSNFLTSVN